MYIDNVLIAATSKAVLQHTVAQAKERLERAAFVVGAQSERDRTERIVFRGKNIDTRKG